MTSPLLRISSVAALALLSGCATQPSKTPMIALIVGVRTEQSTAMSSTATTKGLYVEIDDPLQILQAILAADLAKKPESKP